MLKKSDIYRDSKNWYVEVQSPAVSPGLIDFCRRYAGKKILDLGCASGDYCVELAKLGFKCTGADVNEAYVDAAKKKGVNAVTSGSRLPFEDNTFDTVVIFEVLEHVPNPELLLQEAKRVSAGNILITVPDCSSKDELSKSQLAYEHFLELDHVNFFTKTDLVALLSAHFTRFTVERGDPILVWKVGFPRWLTFLVSVLYRFGTFKPKVFGRLYAVANKR